jgi:hypothetical protein
MGRQTDDADQDQVYRHDVVQKSGLNQDQYSGEDSDDWLNQNGIEGHDIRRVSLFLERVMIKTATQGTVRQRRRNPDLFDLFLKIQIAPPRRQNRKLPRAPRS